jgi:hypothetical protein
MMNRRANFATGLPVHQTGKPTMAYLRFAAMIATSTVAMYVMMYLNTYSLDHVYWSQTRAWMALYMGAGMAIIMLAYMLGMYPNRAAEYRDPDRGVRWSSRVRSSCCAAANRR